jgi:hypothetical protein
MKTLRKLFIAACAAFTLGNASADPLGQQLSFTAGTGTTWNVDWAGVSNRTYFIQWSLDLENWNYAPTLDFGTSPDPYGIETLGVEKFFVRLRYIDADWVSSLQEARDADFDADGIPNYFEVEDLFSDPFDRGSNGGDTDLDGLADGWELFFFGNLTSQGLSGDPDLDGLLNSLEAALSTNPNGSFETMTGAEAEVFIPN